MDTPRPRLLQRYPTQRHQAPPGQPYDLRDGDSIKIGKYTSILVQIDCHEESQLRRNPRRRAAEKDARGRGGTVSKESEAKCEEKGEELRTGNRRKARPRKARVLKSEDTAEEFPDRESENVRPVEQKAVRQVSTRRTRSAKNEESVVSDSILETIPENFGVVCRELEIMGKKKRGGSRRRNLDEDAPNCARVDALKDKENLEEKNRIDVDNGAAVGRRRNLGERAPDCIQVDASEDKENLEEKNRIDVDNGAAVSEVDEKVGNRADSGVKRGGAGFGEDGACGVKAERVREYMVEQMNDKSKVPVG
ncbi:hypothetical protein FH972_008363 [Carpinus fangiana]|uniref:Uncharacterized protein n=1 Tax=Carpinus fangiana TaxID=176857 RepID=A0A5N6QYF0_9ROSI|nr:hypothetical protein FH972_008363 [Carpinus fangiana]